MVAKMKNNKTSLALLSSKRTKADSRTRADEAFALPSFPEAAASIFQMELPPRSCKEVAMECHNGKDLENLRRTMLQHEAMFKEQVRELHRLYQVQQLLMAASKGKIVNTSSDPASSSSSLVNNSELSKPEGTGSPMEALSGPKVNSMQKCQDLVSMPGQFTAFDPQMHVKATQEGVQHSESFGSLKYHKKERPRRTFDLERPAEEYIDVDYEEEMSPEGYKLPNMVSASKSSHLMGAPVSQHQLSGRDAYWSSSMGFEKETVDSACRGLSDKNATQPDGNGGDNCFLFQRPVSGNTSLSVISARLDCSSQEALAFPAPMLSTKSLLGGLLGQNHEDQLEDKITLDMRGTHSAMYKERRAESRFSEAETDSRPLPENSTPPQWFLKGQAHPMKTLPSQAVTQNLSWHQSLPLVKQKQVDHGFSRKHSGVPENNIVPTVSQELTRKGSAWPNTLTSICTGQITAMESQAVPLPGLSQTNGMHESYRFLPQVGDSSSQSIPVVRDDKGAQVSPVFMSSYSSTPAVDMPAPVLDTHAASMMCPHGFSSRGGVHTSTTQPWFQQNGLFPPDQQQQLSKVGSGSLPFTCERFTPCDNKAEDANLLGSVNVIRSDPHGQSDVTNDGNYSRMQAVPSTARLEVPVKGTIFGNTTSRTDVELTLGLSTNKANSDPSCFGQLKVKQERVESRLPFSMDGCAGKSQTGSILLRKIDSVFSDSSAGNGKMQASRTGFQHGIEATKLHEDSSINVVELELTQEGSDGTMRERKELLAPEVEEVKEVPDQQRKDQLALTLLPKEITGKRESQNLYQIAVEHVREQRSFCDEFEAVSSLGECNDGKSRNERVHGSVSGAGCALIGVASDGRISKQMETVMLGRSSDRPLVKTCDIRGVLPTGSCNPIVEASLGCCEGCQSQESELVRGEDASTLPAPLSDMQTDAEVCGKGTILVKAQVDTYMSPVMSSSLPTFKSEVESDALRANQHDGGDNRVSKNARKHEEEVLDQSNQAAEVLLSLAFDLSSVVERKATEDDAAHTQEKSLEWFANVIPREDESGILPGNKDAAGSFQPLKTFEGIRSVFEPLGEATSRNSEISVENRPQEAQSSKKLDFFETVTLMLQASGLDTDEINSQAIDSWQIEEECESVAVPSGRSRRARGGKDFQREMLPSIASLSRQEITEDIQMLGGLVRSATEMVAKSASCLPLKEEDSWTHIDVDSIITGGTKGLCLNLLTRPSKKEEMENQNGFFRISSWGELTRRRQMRRHRSQWSLLPLGIGISSP